MNAQSRLLGLVACSLLFGPPLALASEGASNEIGFYTAVSGQVSVTHPQEARALPVKLNDGVRFKDVIQTFDESRTKAFFKDDSMLTIGEKSRVEVDEYIYNPDQNVRKAIVKLMQGQVRALVSKVFKANGSKFEIHTPSAVAAARGTYFSVWVENGQSGIINIGETGRVDFTSGGVTVAVDPGYFSVAWEGQSPTVPLPHYLGQNGNGQSGTALGGVDKNASKHRMILDRGLTASHALSKVELLKPSSQPGLDRALAAVERTLLRETPPVLSPLDALEAMNHQERLVTAMKAAVTLSTQPSDGNATSSAGGVTGAATVGSVTTASVSTGSVSTVSASVGSVTTATVAVAPVTTVLAPVTTVLAPVTPVVAPIVTTVIATPPAVINGALNNLPKLP